MNETVKPAHWKQSGIRWLWIAALVIIVDQITKLWIENNMALGERIYVLPVFDIVRAHNPGAAFSFLADAGGWQRWVFSLFAIGASIAIVYWLRTVALSTHSMLACGLALILGGAVGNVIDRLEHGFVVDFVHVHWGAASFPAFNVADAAISIGAAFVIIDALLDARRERALRAGKSGS